MTQNLVLKKLLHTWKSLGDSTEDRAVANRDLSKNNFTILSQVRQGWGSLNAQIASSSLDKHHALVRVDTLGA